MLQTFMIGLSTLLAGAAWAQEDHKLVTRYPGSTITDHTVKDFDTYKLVTGTGGLADRDITPDTRLLTKPYLTLGDTKFYEWNRRGWGPCDIYCGFGHSSDTFFYQVAGMLGIDRARLLEVIRGERQLVIAKLDRCEAVVRRLIALHQLERVAIALARGVEAAGHAVHVADQRDRLDAAARIGCLDVECRFALAPQGGELLSRQPPEQLLSIQRDLAADALGIRGEHDGLR